MRVFPLSLEDHLDAIFRIWQEVGWISWTAPGLRDSFSHFLRDSTGYVGEIENRPESCVTTCPGKIRYLSQDLSLTCITSVTTSHVARKQNLAQHLTVHAIAEAAASGSSVAALGMFEQGFYNRFGFGSGPYNHVVSFDPADLRSQATYRPPQRLSSQDWQAVHASRLERARFHGGCTVDPAGNTRWRMEQLKQGFGLGYFDGPGDSLSHHLWFDVEDFRNGPYTVQWLACQSPKQLLELLTLLQGFGDQVRLVRMTEPPGIQLQDLINKPISHLLLSKDARFEQGIRSISPAQDRILDLASCLSKTQLPCAPLRFNLHLSDPIEQYLDAKSVWRGCGGTFTVTLGEESAAETGATKSLPTLDASVNAFTRLWLGVRPASGLAITDDLSGPESLLQQLDEVFRLPVPLHDWEF